jgi:hypothetical protein
MPMRWLVPWILGLLAPGGAAAVDVNRIDPDATDVLRFGQTALQMCF